MTTETLPDIIELIDDDIDPFGDRTSRVAVHDAGGPRWVGPVAAAALIALIGYGVATTAASSGVPKVKPAASTIPAPSTTQPVPTTSTTPAQLVPYYAADPPREYRVRSAEIQGSDQPLFERGNYQLWAKSDASASDGSWFSIESRRVGPQSIVALDAYRLEVGDQTMTIAHQPGGQTVTQASVSKVMSITITSFGWADADLVRLAQSVIMSDNSVGNEVDIHDPSLIADYQMISSVQPWLAVQGTPVEQVSYSTDDFSSFLSISVAPRPAPSEGGSTLDREIALRFFLDGTTRFEVDGHVATAGLLIGAPDQSVATWIAKDHIVTLSGQMPVDQLVSIAKTVHEVSSSEWDGMRFQAARDANGFNGKLTETEAQPISFGTDADGEPWVIKVGLATLGNRRSIDWQWGDLGYGSAAAPNAAIHTVVDDQRTYVLAQLPRATALAPAAQLQVTREGLDPILVPFTDTDPTFENSLAAYAFSEPTTYTAQIIGTDGTVLASWPST